MPYGLILLVGAIALSHRYAAAPPASVRSKRLVAGAAIFSLVIPPLFLAWYFASLVL